MRIVKYIGLLAGIVLIASCFFPWVVILSRQITVTGIDSTGTNFGRPGYFHFVMAAFFLLFTLTPRVWAKRANLLITALNLGWSVRNFFIISACEAGECPVRKLGLILSLVASIAMLVSALFPDMKTTD
jgi:hypothetical protein